MDIELIESGSLMQSETVQVRNKCKKLPLGAVCQVRRGLRWIDFSHLEGIQYIELIDRLPDVNSKSPDWYKELREKKKGIYGWYNEQTVDDSAGIVLHMADLYKGIPAFLWWTTVPTLLILRSWLTRSLTTFYLQGDTSLQEMKLSNVTGKKKWQQIVTLLT